MIVFDRILRVPCRVCDTIFEVPVQQKDYRDWQMGKFCQDAFPYLQPEMRELIISQTCSSCWDDMFREK